MDRKYTALINRFIETWLPAGLADTRWFARALNFAQGRGFGLDAPFGGPTDLGRGRRERDYSTAQGRWVISQVVGESALEVGCGRGLILSELRRAGKRVLGVDPHAQTDDIEVLRKEIEDCDLAARSWDTVISIHTLEHLAQPRRVLREMLRIARRRVVIVVPRQRYRRYTYDSHIHFFPDETQLRSQLELPDSAALRQIDGDWCFTIDVEPAA